MAENNVNNYLRWITPTVGDPTYSLLKAHLLIEELIRAHLGRTLPHPKALDGSRLTFVQLLSVSRAVSTGIAPDHWMWHAMGELNRLRNMMSHETQPKLLAKRLGEYANFIREHSKVPFPEPVQLTTGATGLETLAGPLFTRADMATLGLYIEAASRFGFDVEAFVKTEASRAAAVGDELGIESPDK